MADTKTRSPLPLICTGQETSKIIETVRDNDGRWVANCANGYGRLFATAPDLLALAKEMAAEGVRLGVWADKARALIKKAGET